MAVPAMLTASTSPSPAKVPVVIATVAPASVRLSRSEIVTLGDSVTGAAFSVKLALVATLPRVGGLLTAVMLTVEVAVPMGLLALPSLSVQVTVRVGLEPKLLGFGFPG